MPHVRPALRVMIVDDHQDTLDMYAIGLRAGGFEVVPVAVATTACESAACTRPDVIVTDVRLADGCGLDLARRLRALPGLDRTPIVLLTGDPRTAQQDGAPCWQRVLLKPCTPTALAGTLHAMLDDASLVGHA
jgi:CheY-like chemotaxis protein